MFAKHAEILICCAISISFDSWRESIKCALHKQVEYHYVLTPILCPCLCLSLINRMTSTIYQLQYQRQRPQRGPNCAQYTWATLLARSKSHHTTHRTSIIVTVSQLAIFHQMNIFHNGVHLHFPFFPYQNVHFSTRKWSSCIISKIQVVLWSNLHSFLCLVLRFKGTNTHTWLKLNIVAAARLLWPFYIARPVHLL